MASRYSAGLLTSAGSTTLPLFAIVGASTIRPRVWEIGLFNTTAVAVALKLVRMTTAGTPGTAASAICTHVPEDSAPVAAFRGTYTGAAPTITDAGYRCVLGAAVGSGCIWTFGDTGIIIPAVTAAGLGVVAENGTGQAIQAYGVWSE
jgi:hypothetical protein